VEGLNGERFGVLPKGRDVIDLAFARTPEFLEFSRKRGFIGGNSR